MKTRSKGAIRSGLATALVSILLAPAPAPAEDLAWGTSVMVGSKVRLLAPGALQGRLQGIVSEMDEKTLVVLQDNRPVRVSRGAVTRLEVSTGTHRKTVKGMIIGAAIGAALFATEEPSDSCEGAVTICYTSRAGAMAWGAVGGAAWGAGIGALIKKDRWSPVALERVQLTLGPVRGGGVALGVSVAF